MISYHPAKFGGHRHCGGGDINISANTVNLLQMWDVATVTIYTYPLTSAIFIFFKAHSMLYCHI